MAPGSSKQSSFLFPLLIILIVAAIIFIAAVLSYISHPNISPTATNIPLISTLVPTSSQTPSPTSTITLTPRPTWTLRPSSTSTDTPTPSRTATATLIRTITPAKPAQYNDRYELKPWELALQLNTIEQMKASSILVPSKDAFRALAYAEGEALLRFPQAIDSTNWRWDRAFSLTRIQDPEGMVLYISLIKSALDSGQVRIIDLPAWFNIFETRLSLNVYPQAPLPGELSREIIEISDDGGSAFLWLIESPSGTIIDPLLNDISYDQSHKNAYSYEDLTGDTSPDLVIYRVFTAADTTIHPPLFYDLTTSPPTILPHREQLPMDFGLEPITSVEAVQNANGSNDLKVTNQLLPSCPLYIHQMYNWNGTQMVASPLSYNLEPVPDLLAQCQTLLDDAAAFWPPEAAITVESALLTIWPPEMDTKGFPYPADAKDELRYQLAIQYALADEPRDSIRTMNEIIDAPVVESSSWVTPARQFLAAYINPEDLYIACAQSQDCNLRQALKTLVNLSGLDDPTAGLEFLQSHGVSTVKSGYMDFDQDGQNERWLIILPRPGEKLEYWILAKNNQGVQAIFVKLFEASDALPHFHEPAGIVPIVQFELHKGFILKRLPDSAEAYIEWVDVEYSRPTIILDGYHLALKALMNGSKPQEVLDSMLNIYNSARFKGDCIAFLFCDQFHYTLGLLYDLVGMDGDAIDQYLWVWRNYTKSPYANMARLKLDYFPLPTYTRTAIFTSTPFRSSTPTVTRTPTPTFTRTPTPTPTFTQSPTPTNTSQSVPD